VKGVAIGEGGNINVTARSIRLDNQAQLTAETASGNGGDITLQAQDLLLMRRNSKISTTAGTAQAGGDGGNIDIDTDNLVALENSDITANAFQGRGGRVEITVQGIFGTQARVQQTPESDITATSELGLQFSGTVEINTPDIDPTQGLVELPVELIEASGLIAQGCAAGGENEFIITGRGGLPPNPSDPLSSDTVWSDLRTSTQQAEAQPSSEEATEPTSSEPAPIVEATGWVTNNKGEVVLTATAPTVTAHIPWIPPAQCHTP
jgi:large exoprotein involved in heme utilization and adhesion